MARLTRLTVPGYLHHVVQRGNNRQAIFSSVADHEFFLALVHENAQKFSVAVHAYVSLENQFQLLLTPTTDNGLPQLMQAVSRRYVRHFNTAYGRTGTLWDGRYRSTLLEPTPYLFACMTTMDMAPVAAGLVPGARDYPWSSHSHYAGLRIDRLVTPHPQFWTLGNTPFSREAAYADLVRNGISATVEAALQQAVQAGWALGSQKFHIDLQKRTTRRLKKLSSGRPVSSKTSLE